MAIGSCLHIVVIAGTAYRCRNRHGSRLLQVRLWFEASLLAKSQSQPVLSPLDKMALTA